MGAVEPYRQKERSVMFLAQVSFRPCRELGVGRLRVVHIEAAPIEVAGPRDAVGGFLGRMQETPELVVGFPRGRLVLRAVKRLAAPEDFIPVQHEVLG